MKLTGTEIFRLSYMMLGAGIFLWVGARFSGISIWHLVALAATMAPIALFQARVDPPRHPSNTLFPHHPLRPVSSFFAVAFSIVMIIYAWNHGFWRAVIFFLIGMLGQGPYYVLMKVLPNELYLIPFAFAGFVALYYVALF